jgi:hypothetical protein
VNSAGIKAKGRDAENRVVAYLNEHLQSGIERRRLTGSYDKGDVSGIPFTVIEVKAEKAFNLAGWTKELATEITNAGARTGAVIAKKRGTLDVSEWYCILPVRLYVELLRAYLKEGK